MTPTPMHQHPVIALSGYAGAGKDESAKALLALGYTRVSFADKLREFMYALNPPVVHNGEVYQLARLVDAYGWEVVKRDFGQRPILQRCGTDAGRKVLHENVWVDAVMRDLPDTPVVFTDCRFPNEAAAALAAGGIVVRINRDGVGPAAAEDGTVHESETALDDHPFDYVVRNDGSVAELHAAIAAVEDAAFVA